MPASSRNGRRLSRTSGQRLSFSQSCFSFLQADLSLAQAFSIMPSIVSILAFSLGYSFSLSSKVALLGTKPWIGGLAPVNRPRLGIVYSEGRCRSNQANRPRRSMAPAKAVFTPETFQFFRDLSRHNCKEWMDANRDRYQAALVQPFRRLLEELAPAALELDSRFDTSGHTGPTFSRINRDIRFAKDKTLYKTHM